MQIIKSNENAIIVTAKDTSFDHLTTMAEKTVSKSSARVYKHTWGAWQKWCMDNGANPLDFTSQAIYDFLAAGDTTKATMHNRISALRVLAQILGMIGDDRAKLNYELLKKFKNYPAPSVEATNRERVKVALTPGASPPRAAGLGG